MTDKVPLQGLTVFLLKSGLKSDLDALKDRQGLRPYRLRRGLPFKGVLYLARQRRQPPQWVRFLQTGSVDDMGDLFNSSNSGVLLVRAAKRDFALAFGYGKALLRPEAVERAFGLRVVLNTVDPEAIRSVDARNIQEITIHTRRQASRGSPLEAFSVDTQADLLRAVTGTPRDKRLAQTVSGADALQLRSRVTFRDLGEMCAALLKAFRAGDYRRHGFGFVDHIAAVSDPELLDALDAGLTATLVAGRVAEIHLSPPEIVDWADIDGFSFTARGEPTELTVDAFLGQVRRPDELTADRLRRQHVFVHYGESQAVLSRWTVYRTIVTEQQRQGRHYILSAGDWFEVEKTFVGQVAGRMKRIAEATLKLPAARAGEKEGEYNRRVAKSTRGVYLTDRKLLREGGSKIELCDLYTTRREFVHVKKWDASSTLSHLFSQGAVSAETFVSDGDFRERARDLLKGKASNLASHVPVGRPTAGKYEVVFAIIKRHRLGTDWRESLPFFARLNMVRTAEQVRRLGFNVSLLPIDISD